MLLSAAVLSHRAAACPCYWTYLPVLMVLCVPGCFSEVMLLFLSVYPSHLICVFTSWAIGGVVCASAAPPSWSELYTWIFFCGTWQAWNDFIYICTIMLFEKMKKNKFVKFTRVILVEMQYIHNKGLSLLCLGWRCFFLFCLLEICFAKIKKSVFVLSVCQFLLQLQSKEHFKC